MFGKKLKQHLDDNGIRYSYIAKEAGLSQSTFSAILHEKRKVTAEEYLKFCDILKVDADYFAKKIADDRPA